MASIASEHPLDIAVEGYPKGIRIYQGQPLSSDQFREARASLARVSEGVYEEARRLFWTNEVDSLLGVSGEELTAHDHGLRHRLLIGSWRSNPIPGLVVRMDLDNCYSLALHNQPYSNVPGAASWFLSSRADLTPPTAYLSFLTQGSPLEDLPFIKKLGDQFVGSINGYLSIARSRKPVPIPA